MFPVMLILLGLGLSLCVSAAELLLFSRSRTGSRILLTLLKNFPAVTLPALGLFRYALGHPHFLSCQGFVVKDYVNFILLALAVGLVLLLCRAFAGRYLTFEPETPKKGAKPMALKIASVVLVFLGCLCFFLTRWAKAEYGDLPADQLIITYATPITGSSMVDYVQALEGPVFLSLLLATLFALPVFSSFRLLYHGRKTARAVLTDRSHRVLSLTLAIALLLGGMGYGLYRFRAPSVFRAFHSQSLLLDEHYVDPREANLRFPEQKRNFIHIYLESMENSYMSRENGGFMEQDLIPQLTEIAGEGCSFSHMPQGFGGPRSCVGTTWSVASMVNMATGLPMKVPQEGSDYGSAEDFLPGAWSLGDILRQEGYEQTVMFGADADFGGLTYYFKGHGDYKIMDYKYARDTGFLPKDYFVWWGYEDDKLFPYAMEELTRLGQTGKPFCFIMETADTHRPDGYLSPNAPTPHGNQYANVLSYNAGEVEKFLRWIQAQPFYENTTVLITGDHLSMETNFFRYYRFDPDYRRSQYNVLLNPAPGTAPAEEALYFNRDYANFDFFPTILTALGVTYEGSRLGIGTDLLSGDPTLFEELGFRYVDRELEKESPLYTEVLLGRSKK